jgi:hypothetical protein
MNKHTKLLSLLFLASLYLVAASLAIWAQIGMPVLTQGDAKIHSSTRPSKSTAKPVLVQRRYMPLVKETPTLSLIPSRFVVHALVEDFVTVAHGNNDLLRSALLYSSLSDRAPPIA